MITPSENTNKPIVEVVLYGTDDHRMLIVISVGSLLLVPQLLPSAGKLIKNIYCFIYFLPLGTRILNTLKFPSSQQLPTNSSITYYAKCIENFLHSFGKQYHFATSSTFMMRKKILVCPIPVIKNKLTELKRGLLWWLKAVKLGFISGFIGI